MYNKFVLEFQIFGLGNVLNYIDKKKQKIKHPINERTGKPLSHKTIRNYKREIKSSKKLSKEKVNAINNTLQENKSISIDALVEMTRFVLNRRGEVGETYCKFVLMAFNASLEQEH